MREIIHEKYNNHEAIRLDNFNEHYGKKTIIDLFESMVRTNPDAVAIIFKNQEVTYAELDQKANSLATILVDKGIVADDIVAVISDRSINLIISILGVLKAGGAYLPIDKSYPENRINYILNDSNTKIVLIEEKFKNKINGEIELIDINNKNLYQHNKQKLNRSLDKNLAYVIYTSGTTGNPKGVMVEHNSLSNYLVHAKNNYLNSKNLSMPFYTSIAFDLTITSMFSPLISGNKVRIYEDESITSLMEKVFCLDDNDIIKVTPAHLNLIKNLKNINKNIKKIIVGGDELKEQLAREISNLFNDKIEIINEYGPTEGTVGCIVHKYKKEITYGGSVWIGRAINNFKIYIMNEKNENLSIGEVGEIVISGEGVARGYLNKGELTYKKFFVNPFESNSRIYKTGDLGRINLNGNIEYLGREDDQVKIRGHRVELLEVTKIIKKNFDLEDVIVLAKENKYGEKELNCYIISEKKEIIKQIKTEIIKYLPEYMIPRKFMILEEFSLSENGKINKKAFPDIKEVFGDSYIDATNPLEEELVDLWRELLDIDKVGIDNGFIELGGHSLIATKMVYKINEMYDIDLSLVEFLTIGLTVRELSKLIEEKLFNSISDDELNAMLLEIGE